MDTQVVYVTAALIGVILASLFWWMFLRARLNQASADANAGIAAAVHEVQLELASASERVRSLERTHADVATELEQVRLQEARLAAELRAAQSESAQLSERANRVPELETRLTRLVETQQRDQEQILRLTASEAEKAQAAQNAEQRVGAAEQASAQLAKRLEVALRTLGETNERKAALEAELTGMREVEQKLAASLEAGAQVSRQLADLRERFGRVTAELEAECQSGARLRAQVERQTLALEEGRAEASTLREQLAQMRAQFEAEREGSREKLALLLEAKEDLRNQFKTLASDILDEKSKSFKEQNQVALGQILDPLKEKLTQFQLKVEDVYVKEGKDRTALAEQVRQLMELNHSLSEDARNLTHALKGSSKTQGTWGELVLERVLEASGLRAGEEYVAQASHAREDGKRAVPDVVIRLPEERSLVVDAKVSLIAYQDFASAEDEPARVAAAKRHLDSIGAHIKNLSEKNYQSLYDLKSLDFVLMFVPVEPAFVLAVTHDRELFMRAWSRNVLLVSPSTLLFVVRTVAHLWRQEAQSRNAQDIAKRGAELYDKFVAFVEDLEALGAKLGHAQKHYDDAFSKLSRGRGNLVRQVEMLKQLGVKPSKSLPRALLDDTASRVTTTSENQHTLQIALESAASDERLNRGSETLACPLI